MIRHWFSDPGCHIGRRNPDWRISLKFDVTVCSGVSSVRHQHWVSMHVVNDLETTKPKSRSTSMAALRKPTEERTDQIPNSDSENSFQFRRLSANFGLKLSAGWLRFDDSDSYHYQNGFSIKLPARNFRPPLTLGCRYISLVSILLSRLIEKLK